MNSLMIPINYHVSMRPPCVAWCWLSDPFQTFRLLLPSVLMKFGDDNKGIAAQSIPRAIQLIAQHAVEFIKWVSLYSLGYRRSAPCIPIAFHFLSLSLLLESAAEGYSSSARILLQHMCIKVPDKAEYRSKVAEVCLLSWKQMKNLSPCLLM